MLVLYVQETGNVGTDGTFPICIGIPWTEIARTRNRAVNPGHHKKEMPKTRSVARTRHRSLFFSVLIAYGTIAATSLEYKLSLLLASTAVTT
jgi:hypothetical protein